MTLLAWLATLVACGPLGSPSAAATASGAPSSPASASVPIATSSAASVPAEPGEQATPLEVRDQGFTAVANDANDTASWAAIVHNPNPAWAARIAELKIDFYDADGTFIAGEEPLLNLLPGQTGAVAGQAFGAGRAVTMQVVVPEEADPFVPSAEAGALRTDDVETHTRDGACVTTGTLTSTFTTPQTFVPLAAVYRNAAGAIVAGASGGLDTVPAGGTAPFEIAEGIPCDGIVETEVYWQVNP